MTTTLKNEIDAISRWLLSPVVQCHSGSPHAGGIPGSVNYDGSPVYLYPEIAGYYLSALAYMHRKSVIDDRILADRVEPTIRWLDAISAPSTGVPGRIYTHEPDARDWRQFFMFSFDAGMVLRGLAATISSGAGAYLGVLRRYLYGLDRFCTTRGPMGSHHPLGGREATAPVRWSTKPGPYHLKVCGAIALAREHATGEHIDALAKRTCKRWENQLSTRLAASHLHPYLYAVEGLLQIGLAEGNERYLDLAADGFTGDVARFALTSPRSDVIAQALRIGCALASLGRELSPWPEVGEDLALALMTYVRPDGSVKFDRHAEGLERSNVWCAMFSYQALSYYEQITSGRKLDREDILLLI